MEDMRHEYEFRIDAKLESDDYSYCGGCPAYAAMTLPGYPHRFPSNPNSGRNTPNTFGVDCTTAEHAPFEPPYSASPGTERSYGASPPLSVADSLDPTPLRPAASTHFPTDARAGICHVLQPPLPAVTMTTPRGHGFCGIPGHLFGVALTEHHRPGAGYNWHFQYSPSPVGSASPLSSGMPTPAPANPLHDGINFGPHASIGCPDSSQGMSPGLAFPHDTSVDKSPSPEGPVTPPYEDSVGKRLHVGGGRHECPYRGCTSVYKRNEHLKRHIQNAHENPPRMDCPFCGHVFKGRNDNYRNHLKLHASTRNVKARVKYFPEAREILEEELRMMRTRAATRGTRRTGRPSGSGRRNSARQRETQSELRASLQHPASDLRVSLQPIIKEEDTN